MFSYLLVWSLLLAGDPQTPEQLFNLGVAAEEEKDYPAAILQFTEAIGAVTDAENLKYAVMSMRHIEKANRKFNFEGPWPAINEEIGKAMTYWRDGERPKTMDETAVDAIYKVHPYFQALTAANLLIREARANPQLADQYLLAAYILKRDYPITFLALSQNAKRKGNYALASHFLLVYKHQLGPGILPALADYTKEVLTLAHLPSQMHWPRPKSI